MQMRRRRTPRSRVIGVVVFMIILSGHRRKRREHEQAFLPWLLKATSDQHTWVDEGGRDEEAGLRPINR
jgi:hypothetical protein